MTIAIEPQVPSHYLRRARLLEAFGDPGRATADFAAAIDILSRKLEAGEPANDDLLMRAEVFEAKGDDARAMEDVAKVIEKEPKWVAAYEVRARLHRKKGDREAMAADYTTAIALLSEPKTPFDFSERARLHLLAGQAAQGLPSAELSLEMEPDVPGVLDIRGRLFEALGKREEAIADLRRALAKRPDLRTSSEALKRLAAGP
jgi:tetratricopeptide (TPR) repeat protein